MANIKRLSATQKRWLKRYCKEHSISLNIKSLEGQAIEVYFTRANIHDTRAAYPLMAMVAVNYPSVRSAKAENAYRGDITRIVNGLLGIDLQCA